MHVRNLDILRSPITGLPFRLEGTKFASNGLVESGVLATTDGEAYPIIRGIPRFVKDEGYSHNFGYEWRRWPRLQFDEENIGRPMAGHSERKWEGVVGFRESIDGQTVLEFGCGAGRFLDIVRRKGGMAVGIDLSLAVEAARMNFEGDPDTLIVQADTGHPPFVEGVFDGGFTIGVLHHTPSPVDGLRQLARLVRKNGWVACSVYSRNSMYALPSIERWRRWHARLSPRFGAAPALAYSWMLAACLWWTFRAAGTVPTVSSFARYLEREWMPIARTPDPRWRVLDTFDSITPSYASTHTGDEIKAWMHAAGCVQVHPTPWGDTSFAGLRG